MKKGQVEVQLNWIFILIAGAVILTFFVGLVYTLKGSSDQELKYTVLNRLNGLFTGAGVSVGTTNLIEVPAVEIELTCDAFRIDDVKLDFGEKYVFGPALLDGDRLVTWTKDLNIPFKITNFLYLTNPKIAYYFVYSAKSKAAVQALYNDLPPEKLVMNNQEEVAFNKQLVAIEDLDKITNKNNYKLRFVFAEGDDVVSTPLSNFAVMPEKDITAVKIAGQFNLQGALTFYEKKNGVFIETGTSQYIGDASLYAAVFSESKDLFECGMTKAFKRVKKVSEVYWLRAKLLREAYDGTACFKFYDPAKIFPLVDTYNYDSLKFDVSEIVSMNRQLLENACAQIY